MEKANNKFAILIATLAILGILIVYAVVVWDVWQTANSEQIDRWESIGREVNVYTFAPQNGSRCTVVKYKNYVEISCY